MKPLFFILIFACFVKMPSYALMKNMSVKRHDIKSNLIADIYYELKLESMFHENDRSKFEKKLIDLNAPFIIEEVDYKKGMVIVKMTRKAPYNDVKYAFDQIGLRVVSEVEVVK